MEAGGNCGNSAIMDFGYFEVEEREAALVAADVIEFDEYSDADTAIEIRLLAARVQAARHCGA